MTRYLARANPIRQILEAVALSGERPTRGELDRLAEYDDQLPEGESLSRFRAPLDSAATRVAGARANGYAAARELSEESWARIADRMTEAQAAVSGDANPEDIADITSRMFGNH